MGQIKVNRQWILGTWDIKLTGKENKSSTHAELKKIYMGKCITRSLGFKTQNVFPIIN